MGNQTKPFGVIHNAHFLLKVPQNHGIHGKFMRLGSVQFNTSDTTGSDLYTRSSDCFTCDADSDTLTAGTTVYDDANSDTSRIDSTDLYDDQYRESKGLSCNSAQTFL
eukprot:303352_1